jgi:hypothetical protein
MARRKIKQTAVLKKVLENEDFFSSPDESEQQANEALQAYFDAPIREKLVLRHRWKRLACRAVYGTTDPSDIPFEDLKIITSLATSDPMATKYAEKIKSPVTGIRAFCYDCQGNDIAGVRNCTNSICVLFPFRMGKNVFFGKLADAEVAPTEDFEEETTNAD